MVSEAEFKQRLQNGLMIESEEEMTEGYKKTLKNMLLIAGDTEFAGIAAYYDAGLNAPTMGARGAEISIMQDEFGHGYIDYRLLEELGEDMHEIVYGRDPEEYRSPYGFQFEPNDFVDVIIGHALTDRAGAVLLEDQQQNTSYAPLKRSLVKINKEEQFHLRHGETWLRRLANKGEQIRQKLQERLSWYFPLTVEIFGLPDDQKTHTEQLEYSLKGKTNDELREEWMSHVVPLCEDIGVNLPAHFDDAEERYVLDYDFPIAVDEENQRWLFDEPISGREMLKRWKSGGADRKKIVERIQSKTIPTPKVNA